MDALELFNECKKGDIEEVRLLVEQRDVDVNIRDKWDSTPLYYACLCGHLQVVEYLIGVGARCEANTFDGERCLYGALTDDIRRILTQHNLVTAHTIRRDAYDEFLRRLFESGEHNDITFVVQGESFPLHRCLLIARSEYFRDMFSTRWHNRSRVSINKDLVHPGAFRAVMKYIYTGRFECPLELVERSIRIGLNCKLPNFKAMIEDALKKALALQMEKHGLIKVTTVVVEPDSSEGMGSESVSAELRELTQATLPPHLRFWPTEMPFCNTQDQPPFADICFMVDGYPFMCHKMFFCPRSEYFKALLRDHFHEAQWRDSTDSRIPVVTLNNISAEVFAILVHYLYCNQTIVNMENAMDVMVAADMLLVPGLKRQCGVYLGSQLNIDNVVIILHLSRMFQLPRLEDQCVAFMAKNLDQVMEQQEFRDLVLADAQDVQGRQETDTVLIVDELRYHISSAVQTISGIHEARTKLSSLEAMLEDLGIEA
ncbi:ankyrin repeat and BTB/POZ domain-containing protein 1-like isoform X1 [Homarus americanus]|uniref:ankyrin repeat and BTB/POZ domain-containing protein 1-like isoform X1 n=1 Tax=Homarus americanus TaxID=6706 RepID=UPI001C46D10E|nr:ankyrin repeat and BTB/POZ domain-containing protein 1-like isoform X1 [Homarus americanus]